MRNALIEAYSDFEGSLRSALRRTGALLLLLVMFAGASLRAAEPSSLLAHGAGDRYWYAVVQNTEGQWVTHVWFRAVRSGEWVPLPEIPARTLLLSDYRDELLLAMDDGQWGRLSNQFVSGPPLPDRSPILAMAGSTDSLWAVGVAAPAPPASNASTTASTTQAAASRASTTKTASTGPTTGPSHAQLFEFTHGDWVRRSDLPTAAQNATQRTLSMAVVRGELQLAVPASPGEIVIYKFDPAASKWTESTRVPGSAPVDLKLMAIGDRAALWIHGPGDEPGALLFRSPAGTWSEPKRIKFESTAAFGSVSVAAAGDEVRVLGLAANGNLLEQKYGLGGDVTQPLAEVANTRQTIEGPGWTQLVVLAIMAAFVLTHLSRRRPMQLIEINRVRLALAPLGPRLVAGLIDATPLFVGVALAAPYAPRAASWSWQQILSTGRAQWLVLGSWGVYVLHTMILELIWQRSLGKMCMGLRVVGFDGNRPPMRAVVVRNVLRLLDVLLSGFPLTSVFFSPLRQRLGDIPAATLVVVKLPSEQDQKKAGPPTDLTPE